jgi:hypothetical protein
VEIIESAELLLPQQQCGETEDLSIKNTTADDGEVIEIDMDAA